MCCGDIFKWFLKLYSFIGVKSHELHLFGSSPLWAFKCGLKLPAWINAKSHWLHLFDLSPLCAFKCLLKSPEFIMVAFGFSPLCVFKCVLTTVRIFWPSGAVAVAVSFSEILGFWSTENPGIPGILLGSVGHHIHLHVGHLVKIHFSHHVHLHVGNYKLTNQIT